MSLLPPFATRGFTTPPTAEEIAELAETELERIPRRLAAHIHGIGILVEEVADDELIAEMGLESPWDLSGVYIGTPLTRASVSDTPMRPNMILLFREPILLEWIETGEDLSELVRSVLIHEIAHHFGFTDEEIEMLEREADAD